MKNKTTNNLSFIMKMINKTYLLCHWISRDVFIINLFSGRSGIIKCGIMAIQYHILWIRDVLTVICTALLQMNRQTFELLSRWFSQRLLAAMLINLDSIQSLCVWWTLPPHFHPLQFSLNFPASMSKACNLIICYRQWNMKLWFYVYAKTIYFEYCIVLINNEFSYI